MSAAESVVYDIGAHRGDDIEYYLRKAEKVVAVEANPSLAAVIRARFPAEIRARNLIVENAAVTGQPQAEEIAFYINQDFDFLSTVIKPEVSPENYTKAMVKTVSIVDLVQKHGEPYFVKIDVEGADAEILEGMLSARIRPPFLSVEYHDPSIFGLMAGLGGYSRFKLQRGSEVSNDYKNATCLDKQGNRFNFKFPPHSAGPFGDDLKGHWYSKDSFFIALSAIGTGWIDVHAGFGEPDSLEVPEFRLSTAYWRFARIRLRQLYPSIGSTLTVLEKNFEKIGKKARRFRRRTNRLGQNLFHFLLSMKE